MLKFDKNHTSVEGNIEKKKGKKFLFNVAIAGTILVELLSFSGCGVSKRVQCDVPETHAHFYYDETTGLGRYVYQENGEEGELAKVKEMTRTDEYIEVTPEEIRELEWANRLGYCRIEDNRDVIEETISNHPTHLQYSHTELKFAFDPTFGKFKDTYVTEWLDEEEGEEYSEERICYYVYYGYKYEVNKLGIGYFVQSEPVKNIDELPPEYKDVYRIFSPEERHIYDTKTISEFKSSQENADSIKLK